MMLKFIMSARKFAWPEVIWQMYCLGFMVIAASSAFAQKDQPQYVHNRILKQFDFEEAKFGNFESMPMHWYVMGRTPRTLDKTFMQYPYHQTNVNKVGYPGYAEVKFNMPQSKKGNHALQLTSEGGNVGAFVEIGVLPVVPGSDYLIVAKVKTEALRHAHAQLSAFFLDAHGHQVKASIQRSDPIRSHSQWQRITIRLPSILNQRAKSEMSENDTVATDDMSKKPSLSGANMGAWIGLEFELKQPKLKDVPKDLTVGEVVYNDVKAKAWLDDLVIWQVPRVSIETSSPVNLISRRGKPEIKFDVQDLTGRHLYAKATIYDIQLRPLHHAVQDIGRGDPSKWRWAPPIKKAGWYLVELRVVDRHDIIKQFEKNPNKALNIPTPVKAPAPKSTKSNKGQEQVARILSAFVILPELNTNISRRNDRSRFGISAENATDFSLGHLDTLMSSTGLGHVTVSAWRLDNSMENIETRAALLESILMPLADRGHPVNLSLFPVPGELLRGRQLQPDVADALFDVSLSEIEPYLTPIIRPMGQRVNAWQTGSTHIASSFYRRTLPDAFSRFKNKLGQLVATPKLMLPWQVMQMPRKDLPTQTPLVVRIPSDLRPEEFEAQLKTFFDESTGPVTLEIAPYLATEISQTSRVIDFAKRILHAWRMKPKALQVVKPWTTAAQAKRTLVPDPILPVYAHLARHLADREYIGSLPLADGVAAWVFDKPRSKSLLKVGRQSRMRIQRDSLVSSSARGLKEGKPYARNNADDQSHLEKALIVIWGDSERETLNKLYRHHDGQFGLYLGEKPQAWDLFGNELAIGRNRDGKHIMPVSTSPILMTGNNPYLARLRLAFKMDKPFLLSQQTPQQRILTVHNPWPVSMTGSLVVTEPYKWKITPSQVPISIGSGQQVKIPFNMLFPASETAGKKTFTARLRFATDLQYVVDVSVPFEVGLPYVKMDSEIILDRQKGSTANSPDDVIVSQVIQNTGMEPRSLYVYAHIKGFPRQEKVISKLNPGDSVVRRFRFPAAAKRIKTEHVRVGLRETNGPAVLNMIVTND